VLAQPRQHEQRQAHTAAAGRGSKTQEASGSSCALFDHAIKPAIRGGEAMLRLTSAVTGEQLACILKVHFPVVDVDDRGRDVVHAGPHDG
jgi:hypothetical protein